MQLKKHKTILYGLIIILILFVAWDNILMLDEINHGTYKDYSPQDHPEEYAASILEQENADMSESQGNTPPEQKAPAVKKGHHIFINLDSLQMYVYKNGELLKTYPVSGGKPSTPSPLGTWRIISKDTWGEGFGGAWLGFNVPWGKYGIHGTIYPWFIGKSNSSKGCIRMRNKDVKELYKLVPHGTTVTIAHNNRVFRTLKSGDIGSDVKEIQKLLKELGFYHGYPDGKYGTGLKKSVQKFQKENRIYASGNVNRKTYDLILAKYNELKGQTPNDNQQNESPPAVN